MTCKECRRSGDIDFFEDSEDYCPHCGSRDVITKEVPDSAQEESAKLDAVIRDTLRRKSNY